MLRSRGWSTGGWSKHCPWRSGVVPTGSRALARGCCVSSSTAWNRSSRQGSSDLRCNGSRRLEVEDTMSRRPLQPCCQRNAARRGLPLTVWLLRLYPRAWREHYGAELAELLTQEPTSLLALLAVMGGALDARLHPQLLTPASGASAPRR